MRKQTENGAVDIQFSKFGVDFGCPTRKLSRSNLPNDSHVAHQNAPGGLHKGFCTPLSTIFSKFSFFSSYFNKTTIFLQVLLPNPRGIRFANHAPRRAPKIHRNLYSGGAKCYLARGERPCADRMSLRVELQAQF